MVALLWGVFVIAACGTPEGPRSVGPDLPPGASPSEIERMVGPQAPRPAAARIERRGTWPRRPTRRSGQNPRHDIGEPYCEQTAIARTAVPAGFEIEGNLLAENREPDDAPGRDDMSSEAFEAAAAPIIEALGEREALGASTFLGRRSPDSR